MINPGFDSDINKQIEINYVVMYAYEHFKYVKPMILDLNKNTDLSFIKYGEWISNSFKSDTLPYPITFSKKYNIAKEINEKYDKSDFIKAVNTIINSMSSIVLNPEKVYTVIQDQLTNNLIDISNNRRK